MIRNLNIIFFTRLHRDRDDNESFFRIIQSLFKNYVTKLTKKMLNKIRILFLTND